MTDTDLAERLETILEDAGDKWVWKTHESQSRWIREKLLPWIRDAGKALGTGRDCPHANCPFRGDDP